MITLQKIEIRLITIVYLSLFFIVFLNTTAVLGASKSPDQRSIFGYWDHLGSFAGYGGMGPPMGDFRFLPLNDAGRARAEAWSPAINRQVQRQCFPHSAVWIPFGPTPMWIREEGERIIIEMQSNDVFREIWMDGRPHPPEYAIHTFNGFSTGEWVGDALKITTTHIKEHLIRRNGVPNSDRARVVEYITRHDDLLTDVVVVEDPAYLTEPLVRSQNYRHLPNYVHEGENGQFDTTYPCERSIWEAGGERHFTPHYLPGENPVLTESVWDISKWWPQGAPAASAARGQ